ncbi:MAG: Ig-like domain repeat protein, partial [Methanobrevibacter sp.]|nr:Ig-like domain repeat protein [Methanobrevibacter sp.]
SNASKSFKVTKALLNLTVSVDNTPYGVSAVVNVTSNIDDIYTITIGGEKLTVSVVNGSGSASIFLEIGDYSTVTSYDPYNYEPNITEARFSVLRNSEYDFIVDMVDKTVFFSLPMYATGNVTLRIANKTYVVGLINGSANITVPELAEGSNNVQINYTGDSHFVGRSFSTNFTVDTRIVASDMTCAYNSNLSYLVKIIDNNGNPLKGKNVSLTVNKKTYSLITDDKGVVSIKVDLPVGTYAITITALDCGKTVTKTLNVVKRFTDNKNVVKYYNSNFNYKFRVIGDDGNAVGQGVIVSVKIGKKTYNLKTDNNGYITIKLTKTYVPKKYTLTATFKGYTIKNTIKVKQVLSAKNLKVKKSTKKLVLTAKLKQGKKALKNKKIIFKFKGKKYKAKTNKKGIAKVTIKKNVIKKLKVGKKYKFAVTYLKDTIKRNVKVKR